MVVEHGTSPCEILILTSSSSKLPSAECEKLNVNVQKLKQFHLLTFECQLLQQNCDLWIA